MRYKVKTTLVDDFGNEYSLKTYKAMTPQTLITFQDEKTGDLFLWNGKYPIGLSGGWNTSQKPWHAKGTFSQKEVDFFKELEGLKTRTFILPSKGKFKILNHLNVTIHDEV